MRWISGLGPGGQQNRGEDKPRDEQHLPADHGEDLRSNQCSPGCYGDQGLKPAGPVPRQQGRVGHHQGHRKQQGYIAGWTALPVWRLQEQGGGPTSKEPGQTQVETSGQEPFKRQLRLNLHSLPTRAFLTSFFPSLTLPVDNIL